MKFVRILALALASVVVESSLFPVYEATASQSLKSLKHEVEGFEADVVDPTEHRRLGVDSCDTVLGASGGVL